MKKLLFICCLSVLSIGVGAQDTATQLRHVAVRSYLQPDTIRVNRLIAFAEKEKTTSNALASYQEALSLSRQLNYKSGEAQALKGLGSYYRFRGEYKEAFTYTRQAQELFQQLDDRLNQISCLYNLAFIYYGLGDFTQAMTHGLDGLNLAESMQNQKWLTLMNYQIGLACVIVGEYAKARQYLMRGLKLANKAGDTEGEAFCQNGLGRLADAQGKRLEALQHFDKQMVLAHEAGNERLVTLGQLRSAEMNERLGRYAETFAVGRLGLRRLHQMEDVGNIPLIEVIFARAFLHTGRPDSAMVYGRASLRASQRSGTKQVIHDAADVLAQASAQLGRFEDAYRYQTLFTAYKDSLSTQDIIRRTAALQYTYELDKKQSQIRLLTRNEELNRQQSQQQKLLLIGALVALAVVAGLSVLLWNNNQEKQRANAQLQRQQEELQAAQAQLIQREKMASLGEFTAGIAHEIQNPLNFVTNFAEVSAELVGELGNAQQSQNRDAALEADLLAYLAQNLHKIREHGSRAARIVQSMMEHARPSTGERQLTDLNALCDENLRLAYHGQRAKDPNFEVKFTTNFDSDLGLVPVVPQEIGRVLLNLYTNAFYAVSQQAARQESGYQPQVLVTTRRRNGQVKVRVRDNGVGIPEAIQEKIFQPFFTTKPAGEGTGLGLSLSYDIVTKGHGGTLSVESQEGKYTEVIVSLPVGKVEQEEKSYSYF
ncbi:tetratricopeptide repeat protein [Hymenobacter sp. BT188]|uniref:ATP-binding protein n=1 Tax=Hymenobacter sp. BT188 TaxID=2763504 RepID=UPI00165167EC|nr:ATP-binding protein [Hymenobacter sp. BT188]MBC6607021.1 tetratricopeptide repeat protein [Hymenobacter sp. BT188]